MASIVQTIKNIYEGGKNKPNQSTPQPQSQPQSKPLQEVIKPPTTPLTPSLPKTTTPPTPTKQTISKQTGGGYSYVESSTGKGYEVSPTGTKTEVKPSISRTIISQIQPAPKPSGTIEKLSYKIQEQRNILSTQKARNKIDSESYNIKGAGLGLATIGVGALYLIRHPIKATKETAISTYSSIRHPLVTTEKAGVVLQQEPGYATGIIGGTILLSKGTSYIIPKTTKFGIDIVRTKGLNEVKATDVIAPEYFKGQKYPKISKGETAGELLKEFKIEEAGYTAAPKPLKSSKGVLKGTSELPGIYQAPKISPTFLKVTGEEKKLFSFNPFGTLRPTVSKIKPTGFELPEGVKFSSQVKSGNLPRIQEFFINKAEKGKSYIPFIKTEKESVIPFGSELEKLPTKSYFKFEGRRIPIEEYKTTKVQETSKLIKTKDIIKIEKISSSGYKSIGSKSYFNPIDISSSLLSTSPNKKYFSSYGKSNGKSNISSGGLVSKGSYGGGISSGGLVSKGSYGGGISSGGLVSKGSYGGGISSGGFSYITPIIPPIAPISLGAGLQIGKRKTKGKKRKGKIAPSFTAQILDIRGSLPKGGVFGISPFQIRKIPI